METKKAFNEKWNNNPSCIFKETLNPKSEIFRWIINRNGFRNKEDLREFLKDKKRILDAGCGNGRVTALLRLYSAKEAEIYGIDLVSAAIASENLKNYENVKIIERDITSDLSDLGKFDFIYCQEVLHHLKDPYKGFSNLCKLLDNNGEIAIYVYKKKAPVREFTDDFIREKIASLPYDKSKEISDKITELGKILSETNIKIKVPEIEILGIIGGEYSIQRFIYHFFMKCFWNDEFSFEDNSTINYDWYSPEECFRYELFEVREWFTNEKIKIIHENVDYYGITIRGKK
jgi:SAM-dependent methyltransferase